MLSIQKLLVKCSSQCCGYVLVVCSGGVVVVIMVVVVSVAVIVVLAGTILSVWRWSFGILISCLRSVVLLFVRSRRHICYHIVLDQIEVLFNG